MSSMKKPDTRDEHEQEDKPLILNESTKTLDQSLTGFVNSYGVKFVTSLFIIRHLFLAFGHHLVGPATGYIYRAHGVSGPHMQIYHTVTNFPAALEPLICVLSDCYPMRGYSKTPYMGIATASGAVGFLTVGFLSEKLTSAAGLAFCLLLVKLQFSTCNILSEALCMVKLKGQLEHGPALFSTLHFGALIMGFAGSLIAGVIVERYGATTSFVAAAVPALLVLFPLASGWLGERRVSDDEVRTVRARMQERGSLTALPIFVCASGLAFVLVGLFSRSSYVSSAMAVGILAILLYAYIKFLGGKIGKLLAYALLTHSLNFSTGGAAYYFYTDTPEQYPEGPHLTPFFYVSVMHGVSLVFGIIGTLSFLRYMKTWSCRRILALTTCSLAVCKFGDALLFSRANLLLGIPDVLLVLGDEVVEPVIAAWRTMPMIILLASICPRGMEATVNGLLAGAVYVGSAAARAFGALMLTYYGCKPRGEPLESLQFAGLWKVSLLSTVLHLAAGLGFLWLVPDGGPKGTASAEWEHP